MSFVKTGTRVKGGKAVKPRVGSSSSGGPNVPRGLQKKEPSGKYCGSYAGGILSGEFLVNPVNRTFDMRVKILNAREATCTDVPYTYNDEDHTAVVPSAADTAECVGQLLSEVKMNSGLTLRYEPRKDAVSVGFSLGHLLCRPCG